MAQRDLRHRVIAAADAYPGAHEDFPWGERVAKVNKKVFAFLGTDDAAGAGGMTVKLPESCEFALSFASVKSVGYGLARAGWVHVDFAHPERPDVDLLLDWLEESYRTIAPNRLVAELDKAPKRPT